MRIRWRLVCACPAFPSVRQSKTKKPQACIQLLVMTAHVDRLAGTCLIILLTGKKLDRPICYSPNHKPAPVSSDRCSHVVQCVNVLLTVLRTLLYCSKMALTGIGRATVLAFAREERGGCPLSHPCLTELHFPDGENWQFCFSCQWLSRVGLLAKPPFPAH